MAVLLVDLIFEEREKWHTSTIAGVGLLAALVPVLTLAADGADRSMFGGAYVVDNFALVLKALFLVVGLRRRCCCRPTTSTRATTTEGEYYFLILSSLLGHDGHGARPAT